MKFIHKMSKKICYTTYFRCMKDVSQRKNTKNGCLKKKNCNECLFSSDDENVRTIHMEEHINLINMLNKNKMLNNEIRREKYIKFRKCPYCEITKRTHTITKPAPKSIVTSTASSTTQISTTFTYKCIHDFAVGELIKYFDQGKIGTLKRHCNQVIVTTVETGLKPYIDHLNTHTPCFNARN